MNPPTINKQIKLNEKKGEIINSYGDYDNWMHKLYKMSNIKSNVTNTWDCQQYLSNLSIFGSVEYSRDVRNTSSCHTYYENGTSGSLYFFHIEWFSKWALEISGVWYNS